jgi:DNA repair photolyase
VKAEPKIISSSRRTDIPAFYAGWFINRVRAGYCLTPNPYNRKQLSRISLTPNDVVVIVFWTRNPRPMFPYLKELDDRGIRYYFQFTVMNNPREIDPYTPSLQAALETFRRLAEHVGPRRVIWRYDPIIFTETTNREFHLEAFSDIADQLKNLTHRCVISIVDAYRKTKSRMLLLSKIPGFKVAGYQPSRHEAMLQQMQGIASKRGMELTSCAEEITLSHLGIKPGKCIDDEYIREVFDIDVTHKKDKRQREACGCVVSRDIGVYDTCILGCKYCYATTSFDKALHNYKEHDKNAPSLISSIEGEPSPTASLLP